MSLAVTISNGDHRQDSHLRFDFINVKGGPAQVWLARIPRLRNADAFPRQIGRHRWSLELEAINDTQPLEVVSYSPENADQWLTGAGRPRSAHTEILILALKNQFTITVLEHK